MGARRKRMLDDGDDSDSTGNSDPDFDFENNPDLREERELFEQRKRRRKNGKEDALYGVFVEDSEEEGFGRKGKAAPAKRSDWAKAPAFVSGDKPVKLDDVMQVDSDDEEDVEGADADMDADEDDSDDDVDNGSEGEDAPREDAEYSDESEPSRAASPRVRMDEDEDEPLSRSGMGGLGSEPTSMAGMMAGMSSSAKGGIGSTSSAPSFAAPSRGGIGSKSTSTKDDASIPVSRASPSAQPTPSAFASRSQSFARAANQSPAPVSLPASEMAHFSKLQNSFGARMLNKMGWQAGTGLGTTGEGIVTPIESKLRPQKMGIAFKGFKEKTEQSKLEAKRRGETVSDEEDEKTKKMKRKVKAQEEKRSDVWKRPKKVKTKVEHKTYEQILAEAGEAAPASGIGQIIDATGAVPREVSSLADISLNTWSPSNDPTRIPEVRHNIRLIADACKSDLDGLAREAKSLQERKKFVTIEDTRLRKRVDDEAQLIARLQQIQLITNDINSTARELTSVYEVSLEPFSPHFQRLIDEYPKEYESYRLDEIVVAAIAPIMRRMIANWSPLEDPSYFMSTFQSWRRALKINEEIKPETQVDVYGTKTIVARPAELERPMTPFESLLWNIWLPKVRTAINNEWSPEEPQAAAKLYEVWSTFLPPFIRDNVLDQLVLPKVQKSVADWNMRKSKVSLQAIVFPWLPYVGLRMEDVVGDARRKIKNLLRAWVADEAIPTDLGAWKDVFDAGDWDAMLLKYIVPKLGATLRNDFRINPRDQKLEALQTVLAWSSLIRPSIFSQIIETEFFPKWLDVLHIWLIQPRVNFSEVAEWYERWKEIFPQDARTMPGISRGFTRGLQLMNQAYELGPNAPTMLAKPDFVAETSSPASVPGSPTPNDGKDGAAKSVRSSARTHEITFRSIVEEFAATHNLLFIPTGKAHELARMPMFRVSRSADGKKGLLVYILDDAVWAPKADVGLNLESEEFKAISLEDMVLRAT